MARGKQWTFIRPCAEGRVIRFLNSSGKTFGGMYQAEEWLHEHGYMYGSTDIGPFVPAIKAEKYDLPQKLYNFDLEDYKRVNAVMYSLDYREGWVEVWLVEYMCCLDLVLTYKWFDMIDRGEKKEEYREVKSIWNKRLRSKQYTHIRFRRGYTGRTAIFRYEGFRKGFGKPEWGAPENKEVYILPIGERYK